MNASTRARAGHPAGSGTGRRSGAATGAASGVIAAAVVLALAVSGCSSGGHPSGAASLPAPSTTPTATASAPSPAPTHSRVVGNTVVVGVDLPFQGSSADVSTATYNAMQLYLDSVHDKAGRFTVRLKKYDDAARGTGTWDTSTCLANAQKHVADPTELAVMGTYNSGCAIVEVPVLNRAPNGPMLMVSGGNSNPGLTKQWASQSPDKYYPTGLRNYARVMTTDDFQGVAAARYAAKTLHAKRCYVLDDLEPYGQGVAQAFVDEAGRQGLTVVGRGYWDGRSNTYRSMFRNIAALHPDCLYLSGIFSNNGAILLQDKAAVLGDNTAVKVLAPDGFTGYPDEDQLSASQGMYLTLAGMLPQQLYSSGGLAMTRLLAAYQQKYGSPPPASYVIYGVQALQVILAAIARSDGSRAGVTAAVLSGTGVTIPAAAAVLGSDVKIDPTTGDVNIDNVTFLRMRNHRELYLTNLAIS